MVVRCRRCDGAVTASRSVVRMSRCRSVMVTLAALPGMARALLLSGNLVRPGNSSVTVNFIGSQLRFFGLAGTVPALGPSAALMRATSGCLMPAFSRASKSAVAEFRVFCHSSGTSQCARSISNACSYLPWNNIMRSQGCRGHLRWMSYYAQGISAPKSPRQSMLAVESSVGSRIVSSRELEAVRIALLSYILGFALSSTFQLLHRFGSRGDPNAYGAQLHEIDLVLNRDFIEAFEAGLNFVCMIPSRSPPSSSGIASEAKCSRSDRSTRRIRMGKKFR